MTKQERMRKLCNEHGVVAAMAIDQRGSLGKALSKALGHEASQQDIEVFKAACVEILTPYASAVLLDSQYGLPALQRKADSTGVLLAYEKTGYDVTIVGRLPDLLDGYSVARLREEGADAVKLLVYYDPYDTDEVNNQKRHFVARVGEECAREEMPFFFEVVSYSDSIGDEKGLEFAKRKPEIVAAYMKEFSDARYKIDVLKVEIPINIKFVQGSSVAGEEFAYTKEESLQHIRNTATATNLPFIYLSAGVTIDSFLESLVMVREAGVKYNGVLCGRATWQDGIAAYGTGGEKGLRNWLEDVGVKNIQRLNVELSLGASPITN
jgi:tagatose 1,6-diphosphate aldolase